MTTLDVLSGGRAELGIGAAWYEREHKGLGVPFPYEGKHYGLAETLCVPRPIQKPHPPDPHRHGSAAERRDGRDFLKAMEPYAAMGIDLAIVVPSGQDPVGSVRGMAKVAPQLAGLRGDAARAG